MGVVCIRFHYEYGKIIGSQKDKEVLIVNLKELGRRIQAAREQKKLSQEELAGAIGCSQSALSNYEKGKRKIYLSQLEKLSEVLEKPVDYFVECLEEPNLESLLNHPKDHMILGIINDLYRLSEEEVLDIAKYIHYVKWKRG